MAYAERHSEDDSESSSQLLQNGVIGLQQLNERRRIALDDIDNASFSRFHVKLCLVAGVGFLTDAYDMFAISIVVVMLGSVYGQPQVNQDPALVTCTGLLSLSAWQSTGLKVATPIGNLVGQLVFGWLADVVGRKHMYGIELIIMIVATFGQAVSGRGPALDIVGILIIWRFLLGVGIGGDYPLSAILTSEFAPTRIRGRLMTAVFSSQGWGQLIAGIVGLIIVSAYRSGTDGSTNDIDYSWRLLIGLGCIPALISLYLRLTVPETPRFTLDIERNITRATHDIDHVLRDNGYSIYADRGMGGQRVLAPRSSRADFRVYFSQWKNLKVLIGTAYSWFALDIAFYSLSLNSDNFLSYMGFDCERGDIYGTLHDLCIGNIILASAGYLPGFLASFLVIDSWGRKPIQLMGFTVLTILFWIMGFSNTNGLLMYNKPGKHAFLALYVLANFFQNFGPNTTTFIIPGEAFPTRYRSTAHGISAASGKFGAVIAQLAFGAVLHSCGYSKLYIVLIVISFVMMTGVLSTLLIPETKRRSLEDLSNEEQKSYITGTVGNLFPLSSDGGT